jgi:hypothetical protein
MKEWSKFYTAPSKTDGVGLFVKKNYKKDDFIAYISGPIVHLPVLTPKIEKKIGNWIGASKHTWINTDNSPFRFINHSCDPNVAITTTRKVVATKDISQDSEITIDYSMTEADPTWSISPCCCKSKNCRKEITGISKLAPEVIEKNKKYISKKFLSIYESMMSK